MQQYYEVESGGRTLTVFHTDSTVSFDLEHFGGFEFKDKNLLEFLNCTEVKLQAEREDPRMDEKVKIGYLKDKNDGVEIYINGRREISVHLSSEQVRTLKESISIGEVERYSDGQYPVESVNREGERDRASH